MEAAALTVAQNSIVIVVGETGSGKTTRLPQRLLDLGLGPICVTQPRRIAAIAAARRVAQERGCSLGREVGFAVRFDHACSDATMLKFATDGVLLREAAQQPELPQYRTVMLDEVCGQARAASARGAKARHAPSLPRARRLTSAR